MSLHRKNIYAAGVDTRHSRLTYPARFAKLRRMSKHTRRLIALFLLLWLPLFGASAVAESLGMQLRAGDCHEQGAMPEMDHHAMMAMGEHHMMPHDMPQTAVGDDGAPCSSCAICHIACTAFIVPAVVPQVAENGSQAVAYIAAHFASHLSAPLDPPPLVAA
ncbi:MAG: hypothetical protein AB1722_01695 [Pseudomonadota bacterium]